MSNAVHAPQSVEVTIWRLESDSNEVNWSFVLIPGEIYQYRVATGKAVGSPHGRTDGALLSTCSE